MARKKHVSKIEMHPVAWALWTKMETLVAQTALPAL